MIQITEQKYFMCYACCIPVKGATRSIICDIQRSSFLYIPHDIYNLLVSSISLIEVVDLTKRDEIMEVLSYLCEQEYGFFTSEPENFPSIDFSNDDFPEIIKNCIIDFNESSNHDLRYIVHQFSACHCPAIELRFFSKITQNKFEIYLKCFENSTFRSVSILLQFSSWTTQEYFDKQIYKYRRIKKITVYNSNKNLMQNINTDTVLCFIKDNIYDASYCGSISPFFKEALFSNTCLDKKVSIDVLGNIKNCPSMSISFGNIKDTNIMACVDSSEFQKLWSIKKDDIDTCKDCEFRYMCHDCRAFLSPENIYNKPKKCSYDPYTSTWN